MLVPVKTGRFPTVLFGTEKRPFFGWPLRSGRSKNGSLSAPAQVSCCFSAACSGTKEARGTHPRAEIGSPRAPFHPVKASGNVKNRKLVGFRHISQDSHIVHQINYLLAGFCPLAKIIL